MDITLKTECGKFNMRAVGVVVYNDKLLVYQNEGYPYKCLPGGRIQFGEPAEAAVLREMKEEIGIDAEIIRPLWLNQAFFTEDVEQTQFHELCFYFLMKLPTAFLESHQSSFVTKEGKKIHKFEWLSFNDIANTYLYPTFLKDEIFNLPDSLQLRIEQQE